MDELLQAIQENTKVVSRLVSLMEARETRSDWVDPDEAATILGIPLQPSGIHRRRVRWLAEKGFLTRYRPGKPPAYWREELEKVNVRISRGEISYIGKI